MTDEGDHALSSLETAKTRDAAADPGLASLRVLIDDTVRAEPLPSSGEVAIGRSSECHVVVPHVSVSRRHALLRMGPHVQLYDLGSANGTRLRGERLAPKVWTEVRRGDIFVLGDVAVLLHDGPPKERARRGSGAAWLTAHLERHLEVFAHESLPLSVGIVRCVSSVPWIDLVHAALLGGDCLSALSEATIAVILGGRAVEAAERWKADVEEHLLRAGARAGLLTCCPRDGTDVASLFRPPADTPVKTPTDRPPPPPRSAAMIELYALVDEVARTPTSVLVLGETGVGKEVLARMLHERAERRGGPFLAINCAALSESLLESELFGYEKGAFTGASASKAGLLELADGGTVFLDEVGEMPLATQAKLLRVLEERTVWRLGAVKPRPIDVRVIAATNRDLAAEIEAKRFRADLFYRINGMSLEIPPLRDRPEEIIPLAEHFATIRADALKKPRPALLPAARSALTSYAWPGNVRELKNAIERGVLLSKNGVLTANELPSEVRTATTAVPAAPRAPTDLPALGHDEDDDAEEASAKGGLGDELERLEHKRILDALERCNGNQTQAAKMLGITRRVLVRRMDRYGIARPRAGR